MPLVTRDTPGLMQGDIQSFSSYSGADIIASIGSTVFGNIQAIQYAVQREIAPVYVMGSPRPVAYARGKRAITGSLVFVNFNQDALIAHAREEAAKQGNAKLHLGPLQRVALSPDKFGMAALTAAISSENEQLGAERFQRLLGVEGFGQLTGTEFQVQQADLEKYLLYADQIPPFDITISFMDEVGRAAHLRLEFVQLVNEGMGMSIDDVVLEKAITFVACRLKPLTPGLAND